MSEIQVLEYVGSLALVCGLIWGLSLLARKINIVAKFQRSASASGHLAVEDVLFLDPKHRLLTVRWHDQHHLLLISAQSPATVIASRPVAHQTSRPEPS